MEFDSWLPLRIGGGVVGCQPFDFFRCTCLPVVDTALEFSKSLSVQSSRCEPTGIQ